MSAESAFVRTWRAGRYTATLTYPISRAGEVRSAAIEWSPAMPRRLTPAELAEYRAGRDHALAALSAEFGVRIAVLEA